MLEVLKPTPHPTSRNSLDVCLLLMLVGWTDQQQGSQSSKSHEAPHGLPAFCYIIFNVTRKEVLQYSESTHGLASSRNGLVFFRQITFWECELLNIHWLKPRLCLCKQTLGGGYSLHWMAHPLPLPSTHIHIIIWQGSMVIVFFRGSLLRICSKLIWCILPV